MNQYDRLREVIALGYKLLDEWLDQASAIGRIQPDITAPRMRQPVSLPVEPFRRLDGALCELAAGRVDVDCAAHRGPGALDPIFRGIPLVLAGPVIPVRC